MDAVSPFLQEFIKRKKKTIMNAATILKSDMHDFYYNV